MGGAKGFSSIPENIIVLTHREHYLAHLMLWKAYKGTMAMAFRMMTRDKRAMNKITLTARQYEILMIDVGRRKSESVSGENHPFWKKPSPMKGRKASEETRAKQSNKAKGVKKSLQAVESNRQAQIAHASTPGYENPFKGKKHSEETLLKLKRPRKDPTPKLEKPPKPIKKKKTTFFKKGLTLTCPVCGFVGSGPTMGVWHFDNCGNEARHQKARKKKNPEQGKKLTAWRTGKIVVIRSGVRKYIDREDYLKLANEGWLATPNAMLTKKLRDEGHLK